MADVVSTKVLHGSTTYPEYKYVVQLTNVSDGTGEAGVVKIDKSTLLGPNGLEPARITIEKIVFQCEGMVATLAWDHTADVTIAVLAGSEGKLDYSHVGGNRDTGSGGTGDVILTTSGANSGDSYNIILYCRLEDNGP